MAYSQDLRIRVLAFIEDGGSKAEAARRYRVGLRTVHTWAGLGADYVRGKPGPRGSYKLDRDKLRAKELDVDLLVLGHQHHRGVGNLFRSSVAEQVIREHPPYSILLARPPH